MSSSPQRIAANQANALLSTGPKTKEGKEKSRANAYKHGFCANVVISPFENDEAAQKRRVDFEAELDPKRTQFASWCVGSIVSHTIACDRLDAIAAGRRNKAIRRSKQSRREKAKREVETLTMLLYKEPAHAVRRLKRFHEGCQFLIEGFQAIWGSADQVNFDFTDLATLHTFSGNALIGDRWKSHDKVSDKDCKEMDLLSPFWKATDCSVRYLDAYAKIEATEDAGDHKALETHYHGVLSNREWDRKQLPMWRETAVKASLEIKVYCTRQIEELKAIQIELKKEEDDTEDFEAFDEISGSFDAGLKGQLIQRYRIAHENAVFRCYAQLTKLNKGLGSRPAMISDPEDPLLKEFAVTSPVVDESNPLGSGIRNEANERRAEGAKLLKEMHRLHPEAKAKAEAAARLRRRDQ